MMYVYILSGKLFGKNIYEIDITNNYQTRLESDVVGYANDNKILFVQEIKFYDADRFKKILKSFLVEYKIESNYYKIEYEKAEQIIIQNLKVYDVEPLYKPVQVKKGCLWF